MFESVDIRRIDRRMMARKKELFFSFVKDFVVVIVRKGEIKK